MTYQSIISAFGGVLPTKIVSNAQLSENLDTSDAWIKTRTGIKQRHIASKQDTSVTLAYQAVSEMLSGIDVDVQDIDMIVFATTTPDSIFPSNAVQLQNMLQIKQCISFDVQAVCAGFIYALSVGDAYIKAFGCKNVLVIGAEIMSRILDWQDRNTCILFGDGAGCVLLSRCESTERGILSFALNSDGSKSEILYTQGGAGSLSRGSSNFLQMDGKEVFRYAIQNMSESVLDVLDSLQLQSKDIDWLIPHQANSRIIDAISNNLGLDNSKVVKTIDKHANTSAASIPLAIGESAHKFSKGDLIVLTAIGGGLTWGSCVLRW